MGGRRVEGKGMWGKGEKMKRRRVEGREGGMKEKKKDEDKKMRRKIKGREKKKNHKLRKGEKKNQGK